MAVIVTQLHLEQGTTKPCIKCKWQTPDPTNPLNGQCTVNRTNMGSVWKRWVHDSANMTCSKSEEGVLSFRDHV
jgi:benzylsuccinate synthase